MKASARPGNSIANKKRLTNNKVDAFFEQVMTCEPAVNPADAPMLADLIFSKERMIRSWRAAAMLASKGGDFYRDLSTNAEHAQTWAGVLDPIEGAAKLLREMADIMDCVTARVGIVGCYHERFNEWRKAGEGASA